MAVSRAAAASLGLPASVISSSSTLRLAQAPRKNLYQALSVLPRDGIGAKVYQDRWGKKNLDGANGMAPDSSACYWEVTRVRFKKEGLYGRAWGRLFWKGKLVTKGNDERILGALKYSWSVRS